MCQNTLFFDNSRCLACGRDAGFCPVCERLTALVETDGHLVCGNPSCGAAVAKCANYSSHDICNWCVPSSEAGSLCRSCRHTETIPDLSIAGNYRKWYRLEAAKRGLFYELDLLGLPYGTAAEGFRLPLAFDFKGDVLPADGDWGASGEEEKVYTGHDHGRITINIREADPAEREKLRVDMGEAQRTLIGRFRHEIGHYYWDLLVKNRREDESKSLFGDHENPTYADALKAYYANGPSPDWRQRCVSAYATMHPWEDFAETWARYLAMANSLDTARNVGFDIKANPSLDSAETLVACYQRIGIALNELNRGMGLLDAVPEVFVPGVVEKLGFVQDLIRSNARESALREPALSTP